MHHPMRTSRLERTAHVLAAQLARCMPGWRADIPDNGCEYADLVREDGACVRINVGGYHMTDRITFRGTWPRFRDDSFYSGGPYQSITCAASKSPLQLAKSIQRRLLPLYDVTYAKARAYVDMHDSNAEEAEMTATRLAVAIEGTVGENCSRRGDGVSIHHEPENVRRLVVQPGYDAGDFARPMTVNFEVHGLDPDVALQVLSFIKASERPRIAASVRVAEPAARIELEENASTQGLRRRVASRA